LFIDGEAKLYFSLIVCEGIIDQKKRVDRPSAMIGDPQGAALSI
jgi:hypothetical protein